MNNYFRLQINFFESQDGVAKVSGDIFNVFRTISYFPIFSFPKRQANYVSNCKSILISFLTILNFLNHIAFLHQLTQEFIVTKSIETLAGVIVVFSNSLLILIGINFYQFRGKPKLHRILTIINEMHVPSANFQKFQFYLNVWICVILLITCYFVARAFVHGFPKASETLKFCIYVAYVFGDIAQMYWIMTSMIICGILFSVFSQEFKNFRQVNTCMDRLFDYLNDYEKNFEAWNLLVEVFGLTILAILYVTFWELVLGILHTHVVNDGNLRVVFFSFFILVVILNIVGQVSKNVSKLFSVVIK